MIRLKLTEANQIKQSDSYETAAWYRNFKSVNGAYELSIVESKPDFWNNNQTLQLKASIPFENIGENFQSLFCGNPIGEAYDTAKNLGKIENRTVCISILSALFDENISIDDEATYDMMLDYAQKYCKERFNWYNQCMQERLAKGDSFTYVKFSASDVLKYAHYLGIIESAIGIRAYYVSNPNSGHKNYRITNDAGNLRKIEVK